MPTQRVNPKTAEQRLDTCKSCEFLSSKQTCGTPIIGEKVTYNNRQYKTCGCIVRLKVKFPALSCPLGKWTATVEMSDSIKTELRQFISSLNPFNLTKSEVNRIYEFANHSPEAPVEQSNCPSCVENVLNQLKSQAKMDDQLVDTSI